MKKDSILSYFYLSAAFFLFFSSINVTSVLAQETDKGKIVFASNAAGKFDIWKMDIKDDASTGVPVNLTSDFTGNCNMPRWNHIGRKIVFHSDNTGADEIWVMKTDGTEKTRLTYQSLYSARNPSWSPDGTKIAYDRFNGTAAEICIINAYGMNRVCYGNQNDHEENRPMWSPDGRKILYQKEVGNFCSPGSYLTQLWVMNADGSSRTALPVNIRQWDADRHIIADWGRDGKILFDFQWCEYLSGGYFPSSRFLYSVKEDGTELTQLYTAGPLNDLHGNSWAFGGSQAIFQQKLWIPHSLYMKNVDSSSIRLISDLGTINRSADFIFLPVEEFLFPIKNKKGETTTIYLK